MRERGRERKGGRVEMEVKRRERGKEGESDRREEEGKERTEKKRI